jgi:5'-nucleotidase (lipoprotein e(P4) family)
MNFHRFSVSKWLVGIAIFVTTAVAQQTSQQEVADNEYLVSAVLFTQKAAEFRALAYQAYNLARWQLDADLDEHNVKKLPKADQKRPRAIVVDVDETVLDNSPETAYKIKHRTLSVKKDFFAYTDLRKSKAIPGAVEFINYAHSKGVKVFYISNRDEVPQKQATIDNLKNAGFPDISSDNVLLRSTEPSKEQRRQRVAEKYRIVLLIGDNLDDFSSAFERKSVAERFAETDRLKESWGKRFIVIPNSQYGTWEHAIYDHNRTLTEAQKAQKRAEALELP